MALRVVGAGVGRTGTMSLKAALERLLGGRCYHMIEVFGRPDDVPLWHAAADGAPPDWESLFDGYVAAVDWPASAFWAELAEAYPESLVLLSTRPSDEWWRSADRTIFEAGIRRVPEDADEQRDAWHAMVMATMRARFTTELDDRDAAIAAYERHNAEVRSSVPDGRLLDWKPGDGWGPICEALAVPVPDEPFPHTNTTDEFRAIAGLS